jgi:hypothetical protein
MANRTALARAVDGRKVLSPTVLDRILINWQYEGVWPSKDADKLVEAFEKGREELVKNYRFDDINLHPMAVAVFQYCLTMGLKGKSEKIRELYGITPEEEHDAAKDACIYSIILGTHDYAEILRRDHDISDHEISQLAHIARRHHREKGNQTLVGLIEQNFLEH